MLKLWTCALTLLLTGSPAIASVLINTSQTGYNWTVAFGGKAGGGYTDQISASGSFIYTGISPDGLTYNFSYTLTNDSIANSRMRSFGFDLVNSQIINNISATGIYFAPDQNVNFPEALGTRDICFAATNNGTCTGGPQGLTSNPDQTSSGTFSLTFSQAMASLEFDNFASRFQSISPTINGSSSGVGIGVIGGISGGGPVSAAPEPAGWLTMIVGFGMIGTVMRRRASPPRLGFLFS